YEIDVTAARFRSIELSVPGWNIEEVVAEAIAVVDVACDQRANGGSNSVLHAGIEYIGERSLGSRRQRHRAFDPEHRRIRQTLLHWLQRAISGRVISPILKLAQDKFTQ